MYLSMNSFMYTEPTFVAQAFTAGHIPLGSPNRLLTLAYILLFMLVLAVSSRAGHLGQVYYLKALMVVLLT